MMNTIEMAPQPVDDARLRRRKNLKRALNPRHIAFIGGRAVEDCITVAERANFAGHIWPVHPKYDMLGGRRCYRSIADLPEAPDVALLAISRERTIEIVGELSAVGAGGAVSITGEFAETGEQGAQLQQALRDAAGDLALVGPNCLGIMNMFDGVAAWGGDNVFIPAQDTGVALVSQSGLVAYSITNVEQAFPLGYAISIGNQAVLDMADYIDVMLDDDRVRAIGIYIEGVVDIAALSQSALRALNKGVPIVALKAGGTKQTAELTTSHSGTLAVPDDLWRALFERLGIIEVSSPKLLVETLKFFGVRKGECGNCPGLAGHAIVAAANSGGYTALIADKGQKLGLSFPEPTRAQRDFLRTHVPDLVSLLNPLDYNLPWASLEDPNTADACLGALMDERCHLLAYFIDWPILEDVACVWRPTIEGVKQLAARSNTPVVVASALPNGLPVDLREDLHASGIPALQGLDETMAVIAAAANYTSHRNIILYDGSQRCLPKAEPVGDRARTLDEQQGKNLLSGYGLNVPTGSPCSADDAATVAEKIGFPVAVKLLNANLAHKNRAGAVRLNLWTFDEVREAVEYIKASVTAHDASLSCERFLVEQMVAKPRAEFIVGVKHDPGIGQALIVGAGGVDVETIADYATLLLPTSTSEISRALCSLSLTSRINPGDRAIGELTSAIDAVAQFAGDHRDSLVELDVNPLILTQEGNVHAVDALIRLSGEHRS